MKWNKYLNILIDHTLHPLPHTYTSTQSQGEDKDLLSLDSKAIFPPGIQAQSFWLQSPYSDPDSIACTQLASWSPKGAAYMWLEASLELQLIAATLTYSHRLVSGVISSVVSWFRRHVTEFLE